MKTIVLIGMMGCGKSTTGKLLSEKLNLELVEVDSIIEKIENTSISQIFETKGESFFRKLEAQTIEKHFQKQNKILSLGGGAFENKNTKNLLLNNAFVIYLKTSPEEIFNRIKTDTSRPLLKNNMNVEKIKNIIELRKNNYESAHLTITTDGKSPSEIVEKITGALK